MRKFTKPNVLIAGGLFFLAMFLTAGIRFGGLQLDLPVLTICFTASIPIIIGSIWLIRAAKVSQVKVLHALRTGRWYLVGAPTVAAALLTVMPYNVGSPARNPIEQVDSPSVSDHTDSFDPVKWHFAGYECADGWQSTSIGAQGACSHHGGVVEVYSGDNGQTLRCGRGTHPPDPDAQQRELRNTGKIFCTR